MIDQFQHSAQYPPMRIPGLIRVYLGFYWI